MAETPQIAPQDTLPAEQKLVREYIPVQKLIEELFLHANEAEFQQLRYPYYLTPIYDELSVIAEGKSSGGILKELLKEWADIEASYGPLDGRRGRLKVQEWRERKRALSAMREALGMGTSKPAGGKQLFPPLRMSAFNDCPPDCPVLVKARESRRKWA